MPELRKLVGKLKLDITHLRNEKKRELQQVGGSVFEYYLENRNSSAPLILTPEIKKSLERLMELEISLDALKAEIEEIRNAPENSESEGPTG